MKKVILDGEEYEVPEWVGYVARDYYGLWKGFKSRPRYIESAKSWFALGTGIDMYNGIMGRPILLEFDNKCVDNFRFLGGPNTEAPERTPILNYWLMLKLIDKNLHIPTIKEYISDQDTGSMNAVENGRYENFVDVVVDNGFY